MSQQEKDIASLYKGLFRFVDVPFPEDPAWEKEMSYVHQYRNYHSLFQTSMPKVPALFTRLDILSQDDELCVGHSVRVRYRATVLKPKKWVMFKDINSMDTIVTDEIEGETTRVVTGEQKITFHAGVEFGVGVGVEGGYGPAKASLDFKTSIGLEFEKSVKITATSTQKLLPGTSYQPTIIYAKLQCEVVHAREGDFMVNGLGMEGELVTMNPEGSYNLLPEQRCSWSGYKKSILELKALHDACGKFLITSRQEPQWSKASSARLNAVVDPVDCILYLQGFSVIAETRGSKNSNQSQILFNQLNDQKADLMGLLQGHGNYGSTSYIKGNELVGFHGFGGPLLNSEPDIQLCYSLGGLVKVWNVAVKSKYVVEKEA
ncbi:hypothetical protein BGX26_004828 [Mortierella sp. AD094]|nr:hypothetical protein BGX26_004828 [Mortierella sp. AD094]